MNNAKMSIIITLLACTSQGKNHYTKICTDKIIKLLEKFHSTVVRRRWVFQCMRDLEDAGLISRKKRYKKGEGGMQRQMSSITSFTIKGASFLVKKRVSGSVLMLKRIIAWIKGQDKRWPKKSDVQDDGWWPDDPRQMERLKEMMAGVGNGIG